MGALGGIVLAVLLVLASAAFGPIGGLIGGGLAVVAVFASFLLALDSAVGGAIGGVLAG